MVFCPMLFNCSLLLSSSFFKNKICRVTITLPKWAIEYYDSLQDVEFTTDDEMMNVAVELSARNVKYDTGGPFGCAIYERDTATKKCKLFSVGVNRVVALNNSTCHGEMVAIQLAQQKLGKFSLSSSSGSDGGSTKEYVLHTSCEPCAMCLGGTFWSGVCELCCSATKDDAEAIGFDEGPVFPQSYDHLMNNGMTVKRKIIRDQGAKVLQEYGKTGVIYNG